MRCILFCFKFEAHFFWCCLSASWAKGYVIRQKKRRSSIWRFFVDLRYISCALVFVWRNFVVWEVPREQEFSPLKNANDAPSDNPSTCRNDLMQQHYKWLQSAGATLLREPSNNKYIRTTITFALCFNVDWFLIVFVCACCYVLYQATTTKCRVLKSRRSSPTTARTWHNWCAAKRSRSRCSSTTTPSTSESPSTATISRATSVISSTAFQLNNSTHRWQYTFNYIKFYFCI